MKKFLLMATLLLTIILPKNVDAKENVTIYLFRGYDCNHCEEALNYINEHKDEIPEGVEIMTYEVWKNANNSTLQDEVAKKLKVDMEDNYGVPFIVIGSEYIKGYGGPSTFKKMLNIAKNYIDNEEYEDVVESTIKELNINVKKEALSDIFSEPNKTVTIVVYSIFGVLVVGIACMIIFSRK